LAITRAFALTEKSGDGGRFFTAEIITADFV
jgi:hypothetical protein